MGESRTHLSLSPLAFPRLRGIIIYDRHALGAEEEEEEEVLAGREEEEEKG